MTRFNIGDIVVQKSGGPRMTICASGKNVMCQWLVNGKIEVGTFSVATLELAETSEDEDVYAEMRK